MKTIREDFLSGDQIFQTTTTKGMLLDIMLFGGSRLENLLKRVTIYIISTIKKMMIDLKTWKLLSMESIRDYIDRPKTQFFVKYVLSFFLEQITGEDIKITSVRWNVITNFQNHQIFI